MADLFGSAGSAWHQWNKHGSCSGLSPDDFYALAREAYGRITRPAVLRDLDRTVTLPATLIEDAFIREAILSNRCDLYDPICPSLSWRGK